MEEVRREKILNGEISLLGVMQVCYSCSLIIKWDNLLFLIRGGFAGGLGRAATEAKVRSQRQMSISHEPQNGSL